MSGQARRAWAGLRTATGRACLTVAAVALLTGVAWTVVTPLFQVPDEATHFAYVQYLGETGELAGRDDAPAFSSEQEMALSALAVDSIIGRVLVRVPSQDAGASALLEGAGERDRDDGGGRSGASGQPPLYYMAASLPYRAAGGASLQTRVVSARLLSVLMFAGTAVLVALLAAEFVPGRAWVPLLAGLMVALQPTIGFIAGGVQPDNLMNLLAAALLLAMVRGIRRPSVRAAGAIGLLAGMSVVTKITMITFLPGVALALAFMAWTLAREASRRVAVRASLLAVSALVALPLAYVVWTSATGRGLFPAGTVSGALPANEVPASSLREFASYLWQLYLPRLPSQIDMAADAGPVQTWARGWLGRYGWVDYGLTGWLVTAGLLAMGVAALLAIRGLWLHRAAVLARRRELSVLVLVAATLCLVIAWSGYGYRLGTKQSFEQARYLFPLSGIYGLLAVSAALGTGRRAAPYAAVGLVVLASVHLVSGLALTFVRYYA